MSKAIYLNIIYYITSGARHQRLYEGKPFYKKYTLQSKRNKFNIDFVKKIISEDQIDISNIDDYRYYNKNKNGFIKMRDAISYPIQSDELTLQIHYAKMINQNILEIEHSYNNMLVKLNELEETKNLNKNRNENIDLFFLYASPILKDENEEEFKPINYRLEIKKIVKILENSKQEYYCLFECANEKKLRDAIIKQPKILHISSHGFFDQNREYSLYLEENGIRQKIHQNRLREIFTSVSNQLKNIDLVFASTCYSETLGKLFLEFGIENVIYIQGMTPVSDKAAVKFSENFYSELIRGSTIAEAFNKSKKLVQLDKEKETFQLKKCCCNHWHKSEKCPLKKNDEIHKKYHIKCECDFEEYNIHEENCKLLQLIKNDKAEKYFYFEKYLNNTIKMCCVCCKPNENKEETMLPHEESFKFILKQKNPNDNKVIFRLKKEGKLHKNKNCYIMNDKDQFKYFSIVGRRKQVKEIYDIIKYEKIHNIHFIILHGTYEVQKQNFAESTCIYLFERNIINGYWMIDIKEKDELCEKVKQLTHNENDSDGKYIVVIKINYNLEKPIDLLNEILNEKNILYPNFYYLILLITQTDKIEYFINCQERYKIIYLMSLNKTSSIELLNGLCESYGYSMNLKNLIEKNKLTELLEITGYSRKNINNLAELLGKYNNFEKLKELLQIQDFNNDTNIQSNLRLVISKEISKIYCLLSLLNNGLPESMLILYEPNFKKIIKNEDEEHLIHNEPNYLWLTIIDKRNKKDISELLENKKKECICKCLEIYAKLLFYYIKKTKSEICYPDNNIHYNFNSYNNKGIWKTFDLRIYELFFLTDNNSVKYNYIIDNDFILERHTDNIYNLIEKNINIIKSLIFHDNNVEQKEYLNQILLMLPSIYVTEKYSNFKNIISKCIYLFDKLNDLGEHGLMASKQRLNLFLLSMRESAYFNVEDFLILGEQGKADALFIRGLKLKHIESFLNAIKIYEKIKDMDLKIQIPYAYYEIGNIYFLDKKYKLAKEYLMKGLDITQKYNDNFIKDKIHIELALIMEEEYHNKEQYEFYLNKVVNNCSNIPLIKEAEYLLAKFNQKLEPDIVMLNSNPLVKYDNYSVLHNSIWAEHNNQYYILQKISTNLKRDIRIKSIVLNEHNLKQAFSEKGKILILQSDDFNQDGDIILEQNNGRGEELSKDKLKLIIPKDLKYDMLILCFINSEELINLFKGKVKYLITFDSINLENIDFDMLYKYNELSIDFIIHFIKNSTKENLKKAYDHSLDTFKAGLQNYKKSEIQLINKKGKIITLKNYKEDLNSTIVFKKRETIVPNKDEGEIIYTYPLLQIPNIELHNKIYSDEILHIIKLILSSREQVINIHSKNDIPSKIEKLNVKTIISFEVMRFLYRHQAFNGKIFYIPNPKKYGSTLKDITNNIFGEKKPKNSKEKTTFVESFDFAFIVINNYDKIDKIQGKGKYYFFEGMSETFQYLIISKSPIGKYYSYEIKIKNHDNDDENKKGNKKNKNINKIPSKNKISNKQYYSNKNLINIPKPNSKLSSNKISIKENYSSNNIPRLNNNSNKKRDSEQKKKENKNKIENEYTSEFAVIENKSLSDSSDASQSISESSEQSYN